VSRLITPQEWTAQTWKNSNGITHEVCRWPDRDPFEVRVSIAGVTAPGPFSQFPGYHRWSLLLEGSPLTLRSPRNLYELSRTGDLLDIYGNVPLVAGLAEGGSATLLNVLGKRGTRVGVGVPPCPVRLVFAIESVESLERWNARVFDQPTRVDEDVLWIATGFPAYT